MQTLISHKALQSLLDYDPNTGQFTWKVDRRPNIKAGDVAGTVKPTGYIAIMISRKMYSASRLAWFYSYGTWPVNTIDHKDRQPGNNRLSNLQDVPIKVNCENKGLYSNNQSGFNGVIYRKKVGKFQAFVTHNYKWTSLGYYSTAEEAGKVSAAARDALFSNGIGVTI